MNTARTRTAKSSRPSAAVIGAGLFAAGMALAGYLARRQIAAWAAPGEGHESADLTGDTRPGPRDRAPVAFRPDIDAPMTAAEREALRPALLSSQSPV